MAKRTGKDLNILIGGTAVSVPRGWTYEETTVEVDSSAAGDDWVDRDAIRGDFTLEFNALLEIASPYVIPQSSRGTKVTFSAEVLDTDTNGLISGTALLSDIRVEGRHDGLFEVSGTMRCAGTAPTWDLSPAT